jgi:hypothetical protein
MLRAQAQALKLSPELKVSRLKLFKIANVLALMSFLSQAVRSCAQERQK